VNVALLGGTGRVGRAVLARALAAGHVVQALVRPGAGLPAMERLAVREGDPTHGPHVAAIMANADATICALGLPPWSRGRLVGPATRAMLTAAAPGHRIVAVSALGIGESRRALAWPHRLALATVGAVYVADKDEQEALLRASDTAWTLVRPWVMRPRPATGDIIAGPDGEVRPHITTFADVARFIVDTLASSEHERAAVCVVGSAP
jgi:uncharacterized protein YbjT (DUF2867 family)